MIILAPSTNPLANASRSAIPYISFVHSVNFSKISFSSSFSRFCRSSSCLTVYPSSSEYLLPFLKSRSHGLMLPYHSSSMMFIHSTSLSDGFINDHRCKNLAEQLNLAFALVAFASIVPLQRHFDVLRLRIRVEPAELRFPDKERAVPPREIPIQNRSV